MILLFGQLLDQMGQYLEINSHYYKCRNCLDFYEFVLVIVPFIIHSNLMLSLNKCSKVCLIIIIKVFYAFYYHFKNYF